MTGTFITVKILDSAGMLANFLRVFETRSSESGVADERSELPKALSRGNTLC